jgi:hypothetical protein
MILAQYSMKYECSANVARTQVQRRSDAAIYVNCQSYLCPFPRKEKSLDIVQASTDNLEAKDRLTVIGSIDSHSGSDSDNQP